jgi:CDP-glucose 4,6-dehydratase
MKFETLRSHVSDTGPVLLTGHTGFKGTWMTLLLEELGIPVVGISLEPEIDSLYLRLERTGRIPETFSDIRNLDEIQKFIGKHNPVALIHMAAQPLVLESYRSPVETFETNVLGTVNLLQASSQSENFKAGVMVTTDKVYRNNDMSRRFQETDPLEGKDPYSASKVAAEAAISAWRQISKVNAGPKYIAVRAGNVIGGGDMSKNRLIPDLVKGFNSNSEIEIRNPASTRPWQHVLDPIWGYLLALEELLSRSLDESLNFGPLEKSLTVSQVCEIASASWPSPTKITFQETGSGMEASALELDSSRAIELLDWRPCWSQHEAIQRTFEWWSDVLIRKIAPEEACKEDIDVFISRDDETSR